MSLESGAKLGPYEILSPLGKGGMGEVWKARDPRLGREVAVKVSAQDFTDRFEREARSIAALNHPNICTLFDVGHNYLVMELVEGHTLAERIAEGPLPEEDALHIARQIALALEAAHDKGIIHRDLKPANIKIRPDGSVKVLDFGLAKTTEAAELTSDSPTMLSSAGMILGTAGYMAPEQARGKTVDKRADIWAFGIVLYEMVTAKTPFKGETVSDTLAAVIKEAPDLSKVPARLQPLLQRCLVKDPNKRLRDISGVELLLDAPVPVVAQPARKINVWIIATAVLALAATVLGFLHFREKPERAVIRSQIIPPPTLEFLTTGPLSQAAMPELSPNSKTLVFGGSSKEGKRQLWLRPLDSLVAQPLPGTEDAIHPFWSPDSQYVAFFVVGALMKIAIAGGPPVTICNVQAGSLGNTGGRGGTWNKDGVIVFSPDGSTLHRVPAAGGTSTALGISGRWPSFLPDGRHFLFCGTGGIELGQLDSTKSVTLAKTISQAVYSRRSVFYLQEDTLMALPFDPGQLKASGEAVPVAENIVSSGNSRRGAFSVTDDLLIYQTGRYSAVRLTWFDRKGKQLGNLGEPMTTTGFRMSRDGTTVLVEERGPTANTFDLWLYSLSRGTKTRLTTRNEMRWTNIAGWDQHRLLLYRRAIVAVGDGEPHLETSSTGEKVYPLCTGPTHRRHYVAGNFANAVGVAQSYLLPLAGDHKLVPFAAGCCLSNEPAIFSGWPMDCVYRERLRARRGVCRTIWACRATYSDFDGSRHPTPLAQRRERTLLPAFGPVDGGRDSVER